LHKTKLFVNTDSCYSI